jgi:RNA polymerase sigma factor (sigma-70 family)
VVQTTGISKTIEAVWKIEAAKLVAALARMVRDIGLAEDLAHDALVAALELWPTEGFPNNPGAWLMTTAKRRALDRLRRAKMLDRKHQELAGTYQALERAVPDFESEIDDDIGDNLLRLIFTSCHPVLSPESRIALTLRLLGGLTTEEIARAFLVPEPTIAQRIVRAKKTIADKQVPFEVPRGEVLHERLASVLSVIYLIFNEGYSASSGDDWLRPAPCEDAIRLGRILAELAQQEPEVHGLVALMEIQASRTAARIGPGGVPILLLEQDRSKWDWLLIQRGLTALDRAWKLGGERGPYTLQAAIAACHARARTSEQTDWSRIASLYSSLYGVMPTPVIELNRAVAVSMADGPEAGLAIVEQLANEPSMQNYHRLPSVRADFLFKLGRMSEARVQFERAAALAENARERDLLLARAQECG